MPYIRHDQRARIVPRIEADIQHPSIGNAGIHPVTNIGVIAENWAAFQSPRMPATLLPVENLYTRKAGARSRDCSAGMLGFRPKMRKINHLN